MITGELSLYANALPIIALMCTQLLILFYSRFPATTGYAIPMPIILGLLVALLGAPLGYAIEAPDLEAGETMVIKADQAWETREVTADGSPGVRSLHFKGNFRLDAPDWFIRADSATLFGAVDDPKSITVSGDPARVWMVDDNGVTEVDATAGNIEYFRHNDRLKLKGNAVLEEQRNTLRSSSIDYDLSERRLVATGKGGVEIVTMPNRSPVAESDPALAPTKVP